jgi:hypothetical protein
MPVLDEADRDNDRLVDEAENLRRCDLERKLASSLFMPFAQQCAFTR